MSLPDRCPKAGKALKNGDAQMKSLASCFVVVLSSIVPVTSAQTLLGDTVQYEVLSAGSGVFGAGSAVVGSGVEFVVDAAADIGLSNGMIAVDVSASSIVFRGPTTPNTFRYGYQTIRVFSLDFEPSAFLISKMIQPTEVGGSRYEPPQCDDPIIPSGGRDVAERSAVPTGAVAPGVLR